MKSRRIVLYAFFALVAAGFWWNFENRGRRQAAEADRRLRLIPVKADNAEAAKRMIKGVVIRKQGLESVALRREGSRWRLVAPVNSPAEVWAVDRL